MAEETQSSRSSKIKSCTITSNSGEEKEITQLIIGFRHMESLLSPFMTAKLLVSDSAEFLNTLPVEGGEDVLIEATTPVEEKTYITYKYKVWRISNRTEVGNKRGYTLDLVSAEALVNETIRVKQKFANSIDNIISELLSSSYLNATPAKQFFKEPCLFELAYIGQLQRPFDIICQLANRAISTNSPLPTPKTKENKSKSSEKIEGATQQSIKGTAGYFFWENYRGYNFFSVDAICDFKFGKDGKVLPGPFGLEKYPPFIQGPYVDQISNRDDTDDRFLTSEVVYKDEVDTMTALREGKYASTMIFFNHSTGQYEEFGYKITDTYNSMAHLGNQSKVSDLSVGQKNMVKTPTRIMSMVLDHEAWYNDPGIADPEDELAENPSLFADQHKHYAAQTVARKTLLKNQRLTLVIPPNNKIAAGDKIEVILQKRASQEQKKEGPIDEENSGVYLVCDVEHIWSRVDGVDGNGETTLQLFRDSYGMKDKLVKRGQ